MQMDKNDKFIVVGIEVEKENDYLNDALGVDVCRNDAVDADCATGS